MKKKGFFLERNIYSLTWSPAATKGIITVTSSFLQSDTNDRKISLTVDGGRVFCLNPPSKHIILLYGKPLGSGFDHQHENSLRRSSSLSLASSLTLILLSRLRAPITDVGVAE